MEQTDQPFNPDVLDVMYHCREIQVQKTADDIDCEIKATYKRYLKEHGQAEMESLLKTPPFLMEMHMRVDDNNSLVRMNSDEKNDLFSKAAALIAVKTKVVFIKNVLARLLESTTSQNRSSTIIQLTDRPTPVSPATTTAFRPFSELLDNALREGKEAGIKFLLDQFAADSRPLLPYRYGLAEKVFEFISEHKGPGKIAYLETKITHINLRYYYEKVDRNALPSLSFFVTPLI